MIKVSPQNVEELMGVLVQKLRNTISKNFDLDVINKNDELKHS